MAAVVGYTTGVYDMFHIGHLNLLRNASESCDELIVGVTSDDLSIAAKGKRPIVPYDERAEIVASVRYVDRVVEQRSMDKMAAWQRLHFDVMFVGDDWRGTTAWERIERDFGELGVRIAYFPYTPHTSSTALRRTVFGA
ncbi:MAG: glycerol-3-phosphate cytidylyltransferase [Pseudonocardiales bacterium]|nr:MAG: glycerol-3-phosphate cytidylyltransferase [Pseudonocardiales bacterium]